MLKSIWFVLAGAMLIAAPLAMAGHRAQQAAQTPAATQTPEAPADGAPVTPTMGESTLPGSGVPADMMNPVVKPTAGSQAKAKQLYSIDCAMCHGDNGNGKTDLAAGMHLTLADMSDPKTLAGRKDGELFNQIRNGKNQMPAEEKARASDTEVWNMVIYIRSLSNPQPAQLPAK